MNTSHNDRIEQALLAPDAEAALAQLAREMKAEGLSQREVYDLFESQLRHHRSDSDESSYDALADTMDRIIGWCNPEQRIFETELRL